MSIRNSVLAFAIICLCSAARAEGIGGGVGGANGIGNGVGDPSGISATKINLTPPPSGKILLADGLSHLLLADGVSRLCRSGGC